MSSRNCITDSSGVTSLKIIKTQLSLHKTEIVFRGISGSFLRCLIFLPSRFSLDYLNISVNLLHPKGINQTADVGVWLQDQILDLIRWGDWQKDERDVSLVIDLS